MIFSWLFSRCSCETLTFNDILYEVMSGFLFATDQSVMNQPIKTEHKLKAVVWLVYLFYSLANDSTVKDECRLTRHDPCWDVAKC